MSVGGLFLSVLVSVGSVFVRSLGMKMKTCDKCGNQFCAFEELWGCEACKKRVYNSYVRKQCLEDIEDG